MRCSQGERAASDLRRLRPVGFYRVRNIGQEWLEVRGVDGGGVRAYYLMCEYALAEMLRLVHVVSFAKRLAVVNDGLLVFFVC